ncbi:hypothetical protein BD779DRAFT_1511785 [Infundibulicybe gibba]|nr:hypothetical protein BD779DRAFT_1511785 [Infundibulicybe gibba]
MREAGAKATLFGAVLLSSLTIWAVHFQQGQERDAMYKGVLKDDERRREKMQKREDELRESQRKREIYEQVQRVKSESEI